MTDYLINRTSFVYQVRKFNTVTWCLGPTTNQTVTLSVPPPTEVIITPQECGRKYATMPWSMFSNIDYFWQGTNPNGTDSSSPVASDYFYYVNSNSTEKHYVRARAAGADLWSPTSFGFTFNTPDAEENIELNTFDVNLAQASASIRLAPGFTVTAGNTFVAKIVPPTECNNLFNWSETIAYDEQGNVISKSRTYTDGFGNPLQTQAKDLLTDKVWVSQPLYNSREVAVGSTLAAPVKEKEFYYNPYFVTNASNLPYAAADFDLRTPAAPGDVNSPKPVGAQPGTLGWYYSAANNLEPLTPTTQFPYNRSFVPEGPDPVTSASAGPGDAYRMGAGHNPKSNRYLIAAGELTHYYSLRPYFSTSTTTGQGYKYVSTDPNGKQSVSFVDADGRDLASALVVSSNTSVNPPTFTYDYWSYTYYNDIGQVTATVAPKDVNTASTAKPIATEFRYDHLGRMIESTSIDEGMTQYVYSMDGKIRFSQNAKQRAENRFSYTNYDYLGRPVESGLYTFTTGGYVFEPHTTTSPAAMSVLTIVDNNMTVPIESITAGNYTGVSRRLDATRCTGEIYITYDLPGSSSPAAQKYLAGQVSKTQNEYATTWYSYDEFGQLLWTRQYLRDLGTKAIDYTYDYYGNVTQVAYQAGQPDAFYHHYTYDQNQRLLRVETSKDGTTKTLHARYEYYLHGPLKRMELANNLQGVDYVYTITGQLKSINHMDAANDPGHDGSGEHSSFAPDVFGMTLNYHANDYQGAGYSAGTLVTPGLTDSYNGAIKSQSWFTPVDYPATKKVYGYTYDNVYQFQNAQWGTVGPNVAGTYTAAFSPTEAYREGVPAYDKNGNIQSLTRKGKTGNTLANYNYVYEPNTNRLDRVNHNGTLLADYSYDQIGQMTSWAEGGKTITVDYTAYGLVSWVKVNGAWRQIYRYDDRNNRIRKINYSVSGSNATDEVFYVHDAAGNVVAIYTRTLPGGAATLLEVPIYGAGRLGTHKPANNSYLYELNDHLGNVRAVIGAPRTETFSATFETETAVAEDTQFKNIAPRTPWVNAAVTPPAVPGNEAVRLNQTRPAGPGISLRVAPGDVITAEVYAYYEGGTGYTNQLPIATVAGAVATAFGGVSGAPGDPGKIYNAFSQAYTGPFPGAGGTGADTEPAAYLNLVMFDQNLLTDPVTLPIAAIKVNATANFARQKLTIGPIDIPAPGIVYIYLSNNSNSANWVTFDDLSVTHLHSPFVAGGDYYPYGLPMADRQVTQEAYRYGYQGQYSEESDVTGWNEFDLRMYDARFGRWISPDPYGQFFSDYLGMANNPNSSVDINGGYVYILGGNRKQIFDYLVRIYSTDIGNKILEKVLDNPTHHVIVKYGRIVDAKSFGNKIPNRVVKGVTFSTNDIENAIDQDLTINLRSAESMNYHKDVFDCDLLEADRNTFWRDTERLDFVVLDPNKSKPGLDMLDTFGHELGAHAVADMALNEMLQHKIWGTDSSLDFRNLELSTPAGSFGNQILNNQALRLGLSLIGSRVMTIKSMLGRPIIRTPRFRH